MYQWLPETAGRNLGLKIEGRLTREDYQGFLPRLTQAIERFERINLLVDLTGCEGVTAGALWEDVKWDAKHLRQVNRFAVVGDASWEKVMTKVAQPFIEAESKYFPANGRVAAWSWLEGKPQTTGATAHA
ncbi:MAG: STAS/SEC14 domain-containing protein [Deltaproteobacteria bacterium]|nr:STAS/SEC14 domain-containing protein [Deltaproteobacteria bacterium]MCB9785651.1 STAS/SEC14 domain-containing protein [Deltaproteobacteria bacterium]